MRKLSAFAVLLVMVFALGSAFGDSFAVTASAAGVQTPPSGLTYEDFETQIPGNLSGTFSTNYGGTGYTGVYSGDLRWRAADQYGGAGGFGVYPGADSPNSYTIDITPDSGNPGANYFGLWFSALDSGSQLQFYDGGSLLLTFTPANFINLVGGCPNASDAYCGNPNVPFQGFNSGQQYAYLNFFDTNGTFDKIVVTELGSCGGCGFESDNHTIANLANGPGGLPIPTPEPGSLPLFASGILSLAAMLRKRS